MIQRWILFLIFLGLGTTLTLMNHWFWGGMVLCYSTFLGGCIFFIVE